MLKRLPWRFDTFGLTSPWARLRVGIRHMRAGNMVCRSVSHRRIATGWCVESSGTRPSAVRRAVALRPVQAGFTGKLVSSLVRTSSVSNANGSQLLSVETPAVCVRPWWLSHTASLFWTYAVRGDGRAKRVPSAGIRVAVLYLVCASFDMRGPCVEQSRVARVARRTVATRATGELRLLGCVGRRRPRSGLQKGGLTGGERCNRTDTSELLE